jgi:hypothetical protein
MSPMTQEPKKLFDEHAPGLHGAWRVQAVFTGQDPIVHDAPQVSGGDTRLGLGCVNGSVSSECEDLGRVNSKRSTGASKPRVEM